MRAIDVINTRVYIHTYMHTYIFILFYFSYNFHQFLSKHNYNISTIHKAGGLGKLDFNIAGEGSASWYENCNCDSFQLINATEALSQLEIQLMIEKATGSCLGKNYVNESM